LKLAVQWQRMAEEADPVIRQQALGEREAAKFKVAHYCK
jgi:hypothetical protein